VSVSIASAQAAAFFREIVAAGAVWTVRDAAGIPAPVGSEGKRAMPFWSSRTRVEKITRTVVAYRAFEPMKIALDVFRERWLPGLAKDGLLVGVNWSGGTAMGFDFEPETVARRLDRETEQSILPRRDGTMAEPRARTRTTKGGGRER
jgi:hypothetical protein